MLRRRINSYQVLIHMLLVALAATVVGLTQENRSLREPPALEQSRLKKGESLAAFPAFDLGGQSRLVNFAEGERESLVFVFTTVCPACRENQTNWRMLYDLARDHYDIVAVSLNDIGATTEYGEANDLPFPVVVPEDIRGFTTAHKIDRVPLTLQIGRDGKVRNSWLGVLDKDSLAQLAALPAAKG